MRKYVCSSVGVFVSAMLTLTATVANAQITNPTPKSDVATKRLKSEATGAGTTDRVAKWTDSSGTLGDSNITDHTGWIGINLPTGTSPTSLFQIYGTATQDIFAGIGPDTANGPAMNMGYSGLSFGRSSGFFNMRPDSLATAPNPSLRFLTANTQRMIITNTGDVGIALASPNSIPTATLDVGGTGHFSGDVSSDGVIKAKYQDVAEWVPATEGMPSGTVVIVDEDGDNTVTPSTRAYDTSVAGVVSANPGVLLGVASASKAKIATTGRVRVRVDATKSPIHKGDLLVTSDRAGMAMKSEPIDVSGVKLHRPGTLIGKALEPLAGGQGEILVLLTLQ